LLLKKHGIKITGYVSQGGALKVEKPYQSLDFSQIEANPVRCADPAMAVEMEHLIKKIRKEGATIGGVVSAVIEGMPTGLGAPVFDKLHADLAKAMMSINAAKGVEIGAGFECVTQKGTEHRDEITLDGFIGNNAGGILGGISSGQDIIVNTAFKATSSIRIPGKSVNMNGEEIEVITTGRHDPCVGIRATPICEAQLAITLMDHVLRHRAQNLAQTLRRRLLKELLCRKCLKYF